jgi:hypothetical protein
MEDQLISKETESIIKDMEILLDKSNITQSLLARWLREVHNTIVLITISFDNDSKLVFTYDIFNIKGDHLAGVNWRGGNKVYELAMEAGLQEALKLIKQ